MTTSLETITLTDGDARAALAPSRGGMVTRLSVGARDVLYLDESTLIDTTKNVRGGNPVLFPSPGPLASDRFTRDGRSGSMKQHGFARSRAWTVASKTDRDVTLTLGSDDETRAVYPWDFLVTYRYALTGAKLRIEQRFENRSDAPMPFAAGFHPYFAMKDADKPKASIPTTAKRAWDNVTKTFVDVTGPIDLAVKEVDLHLVDHGSSEAALVFPGGERVVVSASKEFGRWVIWTLAGKDFVCLEPWTAAANALNTGEALLVVPPNEALELWTEIAFR